MKKYIKLIYLSMSYIFLGIGQMYSQETEIKVIHKIENEKLTLRWSPVNTAAWLHMNKVGVEIAYLSFDSMDLDLGDFQVLDFCIQPWSLEEFEEVSLVDTVDDNTAVVGQCLHAAYETVTYGDDLNAKLKQKEEIESRYSMILLAADLSRSASFAAGLRAEYQIDTSKSYFFRFVIKSDSVQYVADTTYYQIIPEDDGWPAVIPVLDVAYEGEKMVSLSWDKLIHQDIYTAYLIEKSIDGGNIFTQINEQPYISSPAEEEGEEDFVFLDSVQENYTPCYYRLIGINPFAELSEPSAAARARGRDRTAPPNPTGLSISLQTGGVLIKWNCDSVVADLGGFFISRSQWMDQGYEPLDTMLSASRRYFLDPLYDPNMRNYRVSAFDTSGNLSHSYGIYLFVVDSIAPVAPLWIAGNIDSLGNASLNWQLGGEEDLKGYKILYAHQPDHVFTPISKALYYDTTLTYQIQLQSLTEHIYFRLVAVDMHYNHSPFSQILELKMPDLVPPTKPIFSKYEIQDDLIYLEWANSNSKDVEKHILFRRTGNAPFDKVWEFYDKNITTYRDTTVQANTVYQYMLIAEDDDGNHSTNNDTLELRTTKKINRPDITIIRATKENNGVRITWQYDKGLNYQFKIYRKINEYSPRTIAVTRDKQYLDASVNEGNKYTYWLQVVGPQGVNSDFSSPVVINLQ